MSGEYQVHWVTAHLLYKPTVIKYAEDGTTKIIQDAEVLGVAYRCDRGDLETADLTEVSRHVVEKQFIVKPEPLVRTRKDATGARQYRPRRTR